MGQKFASLLETLLKEKFNLKLMNIWENIYEKDSFQEPHTHGASDFSFIVYKKICLLLMNHKLSFFIQGKMRFNV